MSNTILEKLQEKYPTTEGINDARNIAEAVACISNSGGRGAGAIADNLGKLENASYRRNGATGGVNNVLIEHLVGAPINLYKDPYTKFHWTAPEGKIFAGWGATADATTPLTNPVYAKNLPGGTPILYAIWTDEEEP